MDHRLSLCKIQSFFRSQKILGAILVICMTGMSFMVMRKYVERVFLLDNYKSELEINLPYLEGKPKYETPSHGNLEVYNLYTKVDEDIECKKLQTSPPTSICIYDPSIDKPISGHIEKGMIWEGMFIRIFQDLLRKDEELGLLDLGANIGLYSLVAAAMNRSVLAIEPIEGNLKRFAKAVQINGYQNFITVLPYAVINIRKKLSMSLHASCQGCHRLLVDKEHDIAPKQKKVDVETIIMDDIVPYVPFKKAIMKVDIEGQEHRAFVHSKALMDKVEIPYIFMEWGHICQYNKTDGTEDNDLAVQLIDLLISYGYVPFDTETFQMKKLKLKAVDWGQWPDDIIWSKRAK